MAAEFTSPLTGFEILAIEEMKTPMKTPSLTTMILVGAALLAMIGIGGVILLNTRREIQSV